MDADSPTDVRLTDTQLGILAALCRPISAGNHFATPATNQEIADEVYLSVDAVKGHLRTLYRKFGIEDLPHNQKRARLVELAIGGGYIEAAAPATSEEEGAVGADPAPPVERVRASPERAGSGATAPRPRRRRVLLGAAAIVVLAALAAAVLALAGAFSSGTSDVEVPTPAAFRAQVSSYCRLALDGAPTPASGGRVDRARGYLEVIETMRGRFESLTPPPGEALALQRFGAGLTAAAEYTSRIAESPPPAGSAAEAKAVAELTFAAGQVQAGAVGYGLGHDCSEIGDLVARSAENAAAP